MTEDASIIRPSHESLACFNKLQKILRNWAQSRSKNADTTSITVQRDKIVNRQRQSKKIQSQQYIPLEDKIFASSIVLFCVLIFILLKSASSFHSINTQENESGVVQANWTTWFKQEQSKMNIGAEKKSETGNSKATRPRILKKQSNAAICKETHNPCVLAENNNEFLLLDGLEAPFQDFYISVPRNTIRTKHLENDFSEILAVSIAAATIFSIALRLMLRKIVFSNLDKIVKAVFSRRIFEATGSIAKYESGREIDGRIHVIASGTENFMSLVKSIFSFLTGKRKLGSSIHMGSNSPILKAQKITLIRTPEAPRIPLDEFSNNELGKLAIAFEEDNQKHEIYEKLFSDFLDSIPIPVIATSRDGSYFLVNQKFYELFHLQPKEQNKPNNLALRMRSELFIPEDLITCAVRILNQKSPKIFAKEFTFNTNNHQRRLPVSISTLSKFSKRIAIISIHENRSSEISAQHDALTILAIKQLESAQQIQESIHELEIHNHRQILNRIETLLELINTEIDILHADSEDKSQDHVEFSIQNILTGVHKVFSQESVEFIVSKSTPKKLIGSPSHVKHFIIACLHEFFSLHNRVAKVYISHVSSSNQLEVIIQTNENESVLRSPEKPALLSSLAQTYKIQIEMNLESRTEFLRFASTANIREKHSVLPASVLTSLADKNILTLVASADSSIQPIQLIRNCGAKEIVFHDFEMFQNSQENFSSFHAAIILSGTSSWQNDPSFKSVLETLKIRGIPILFIPHTPRRGDAQDAARLGISAYLRRPFTLTELQEILFTLCNKEALGTALPKGIITRYAAQELTQTTHRFVISTFSKTALNEAHAIQEALLSLGLEGRISVGIHSTITELFNNPNALLFYPSNLTNGQKRQLKFATEGRSTFAYAKAENCNSNFTFYALYDNTVFVEGPFTPAQLLKALQESLNKHLETKKAPFRTKKRHSA